MASPDAKKYTDLTVYDSNATTSLNSILAAARALIPDWAPQTGQIEVALAEAIANRSAEVIFAINRLPGATVETLLELFNLTKNAGTQATATINVAAYGNLSLPKDSEFLYYASGTGVGYVFKSNSAVDLTPAKTGGVLTLAGCANASYAAGTQFSVTVNSVVYTYAANDTFTVSGGAATVPVTATAFGVAYNDVAHGGVIPNGSASFTNTNVGGSGTVTAGTGDTNGLINGANDNADVVITADTAGATYNQSVVGQTLSLLADSANFKSATFTVAPSGGVSVETDAEYFDRAINLLASYTSASTTPSQIKYYIAANKSFAPRVAVFNRRRYRDRDTTAATYAYHNGHILVAVGGNVSSAASASTQVAVSAANLSDLHTSISERVPASLSVDVMSAELADVDVTATVVKKSGTTGATVKTAIESALKGYLDPNSWDWDQQHVRRNEIISLIDSVEGVDYVSSLTMGGDTLIGTSNIGYTGSSGGTKTTVNLDLAGATNATYAAGEATVYYVDSTTDPDAPVVYAYVNTESITVSGGAATNKAFQAVAVGLNYNSQTNGGKLPNGTGGSGPAFTGSAGDQGGTATVNSGSSLSGGSNDSSQFVALSGSTLVSTDLVLKNLGTLVTYGTLNITVT
tara:strand:- start:19904 stop:21802 length:1899 start_codon:yes stop_codon:yes gene_type:complete